MQISTLINEETETQLTDLIFSFNPFISGNSQSAFFIKMFTNFDIKCVYL